MNRLYLGTSGIMLPVPNKSHYPPEHQDKSRLAFYGSLVNSIEINSSFYKIPMTATANRWAATVPPDFRFTFKLFKDITHSKTTFADAGLTSRFMQVINHVDDKKGCLLIQLPATSPRELDSLEALLAVVRESDPDMQWKVAVELRHPWWYCADTYRILKWYGATLVIHDMGGSVTPNYESWTDFVYLRFHGPEKFKGSYNDEFLQAEATRIRHWLDQDKSVFVYFNNTMGDALGNLLSLERFIKEIS